MRDIYAAAIFSLFAAASTSAAQCVADNCLRAVRATAFPTRQGSVDCSSYFRTTVTPAVVTVTATNTEYATGSATEDATDTSTVYETATETIYRTATDIVPITVTVETSAYQDLLKKRQQTEVPTAIPTYASVCSGAARYSSACSCIGVTPTIVTLAASTVTVSADQTVTHTTVTKTITVATEYVTRVTATDTVVTTDATLTQSTIVATATHTNYIPLSARFAVQAVGSEWDGWYFHRESNGLLSLKALESGDTPSILHLTDGIVYSSGPDRDPIVGIESWIPLLGYTYIWFNSFENQRPWPVALEGDSLIFYGLTTPMTAFGYYYACAPGDQFSVPVVIISPTTHNFGYCVLITLKAVEVPF